MSHSSFTRLACVVLTLVFSTAVLAIPTVQAESVKLSAIVHEPPTNGYVFTALAPLPKLMPDALVKATPPVASATGGVPSTSLDVKKKP